jgi:16S rRNA (cytidine1402-2'-O)-methyltransferase
MPAFARNSSSRELRRGLAKAVVRGSRSDTARETKSGRRREGSCPASSQGHAGTAPDAPTPRLPEAGTLFVVATPIGNLEDITLRALRILREVAIVAAEDTRRSAKLLRHYQIQTPLVSLHEHNEPARATQLIRRLQAGESIALISDAGTPGISDPGSLFVKMARDAAVRVNPIPGPNAVATALSASGLHFERYVFAGFPPFRSKDRKKWLDWIASHPDDPVVFFEAPHRIVETIATVRDLLGNRPIIVARELTKAHEQWSFLPIAAVPDESSRKPGDAIEARGEFVVILGAAEISQSVQATLPDEEITRVFGQMTDEGRFASRRDAVRAIADRLGLTPRAVYAALERSKKVP